MKLNILLSFFQVMTGDNWTDIVRQLWSLTGQPVAVNTFFVSYVVDITILVLVRRAGDRMAVWW